jgi:hypothetical protein
MGINADGLHGKRFNEPSVRLFSAVDKSAAIDSRWNVINAFDPRETLQQAARRGMRYDPCFDVGTDQIRNATAALMAKVDAIAERGTELQRGPVFKHG